MRETLRYLAASLALGAVAYYGSEALFWGFPPEAPGVWEYVLTGAAYALVAACVLGAVALTGCGGLTGAFLGGALLGFLVEGVVVATMYDAFPYQVVWTPLAWHAVVTGMAVVALHVAASRRRLAWHVAAMAGVGLLGGVMAAFWPLEWESLPAPAPTFAYQLGAGLFAVFGFAVLARIGGVPRPPRMVLFVVPALALLLFVAQSVADPRPERLALPVTVGLTLWAMARLGRTREPVSFGLPANLWRHLVFLVAPLVTAFIAAGLVYGSEGLETNVLLAVTLGPLGLGWWLWLLWRAVRCGRGGAWRSA